MNLSEQQVHDAKHMFKSQEQPLISTFPLKDNSDQRKIIQPSNQLIAESVYIDTGKNAPQHHFPIWRSHSAKNSTFIWPITGSIFLCAGFLLATFTKLSFFFFGSTVLFGIILLGLWHPLTKKARIPFRIGYDWKTNTLWLIRGQDKMVWMNEANSIKSFSVEKFAKQARTGEETGRVNAWRLLVHKADQTIVHLGNFVGKKDAEEAAKQAHLLLTLHKIDNL